MNKKAMNEKQTQRRSLIRKAGGSALVLTGVAHVAGRWKKPVVDSVILPAHAQTSQVISDIRLKKEIEALVVLENGIRLYRFQYQNDLLEKNHVGVMAQDLISSHPYALRERADGYLMVRYDLLGLRMASLEEWERAGVDSVLLPN